MAVTYIKRIDGATNNLVYMEVSDTLAQATTAGYVTAQQETIDSLNDGGWEWETNDAIMLSASDGIAWVSISSDFADLTIFSALTLNAVTKSGAVVSGNFPVWSGTSGVVVDSGVAASNLLQKTLTSAQFFVGNGSNIATGVAMSGDATLANTGAVTIANNAVTTAKILNSNVTLAKLASGITPSHIVKFAGQPTTTGGNATEAFTVTGALSTDLAFVQIVNNGTGNVTALQAVVTADTLTVTFSADPQNDTVFNYQLLRAAA
jgi:hypothetical protein